MDAVKACQPAYAKSAFSISCSFQSIAVRKDQCRSSVDEEQLLSPDLRETKGLPHYGSGVHHSPSCACVTCPNPACPTHSLPRTMWWLDGMHELPIKCNKLAVLQTSQSNMTCLAQNLQPYYSFYRDLPPSAQIDIDKELFCSLCSI